MRLTKTLTIIVVSLIALGFLIDTGNLSQSPGQSQHQPQIIEGQISYRGLGPEELTKLLVGDPVHPHRVDITGQFTPEELRQFLESLSPEELKRHLRTHQIDPSAIFHTEPEKNITSEQEKRLIVEKMAWAGGLVLSGTKELGVAVAANSFPDRNGPGGPVLVLRSSYYINPNPMWPQEKEIFYTEIKPEDVIGVVVDGKFYSWEEYKKIKGFIGKTGAEVQKQLGDEARKRYRSQRKPPTEKAAGELPRSRSPKSQTRKPPPLTPPRLLPPIP